MTDVELKLLRKAYCLAATLSQDPRTQNGAIIWDEEKNKIIGLGVNRLPNNVEYKKERLERPAKYSWIEHAERDAIYDAAYNGFCTNGATMFVPWFSCCDCARSIIQAGIKRVVGHKQIFEKYGSGSWDESIAIGNQMFLEAGIKTELYDGVVTNDVEIMLNGEVWKP